MEKLRMIIRKNEDIISTAIQAVVCLAAIVLALKTDQKKRKHRGAYEFYSDSKSDEPMARIANKAFLVKRGAICSWSVGGDL